MTTPDDLVDDTDDPTPATSVAVDTLADPSDDPGSVDPDAESGAERGGFADDLPVENGHVGLPQIPGIGFEAKTNLYALMKQLA